MSPCGALGLTAFSWVNGAPGICGTVRTGIQLWDCTKDKEKFAPGRGIRYRNNLLHLRSFQHFAIIFPVISADL